MILSDGTRLYSAKEFDAILRNKKSGDKGKITLSDMILILLFAQKDKPVYGRTMMMKELFLVFKEVAPEHGIRTQDPKFISYRFGPYSFTIMNILDSLWFANFIDVEGRKNSKKERFVLTKEGKKEAAKSFKELPETFKRELKERRIGWDQLGTTGILRYVYLNYPKYKDRSQLKERYQDIIWGTGRA